MSNNYPLPIISTEPGSWAHSTVTLRFPDIAQRVIEENSYPDHIINAIQVIQDEIATGVIREIADQQTPDGDTWKEYSKPYLGKNWLEVPWFFAEHYFYRRLMEAVEYFKTGEDPFEYQKSQGLIQSLSEIKIYTEFLQRSTISFNPSEIIRECIYYALWGNQADLSLWPADSPDSPKHSSSDHLVAHLLADESSKIIRQLSDQSSSDARVDIMLDNAGFELISDLGLADRLLELGFADRVVLHAKAHPTFVSDVIPSDITQAVEYLKPVDHLPTTSFGERLESALSSGKLSVRKDYFWNSPLPLWEYPDQLGAEWDESKLLISKGDANYRRILGDRVWDFTIGFDDAIDFLPVPLGAIRTLKAEIALGLDLKKIQDTFNQDPDWMVNGKWGLVQYTEGRKR
jgi:uncharacterized protein with ATP-grasp and redox domains